LAALGAVSDLFIFHANSGHDTVTDFQAGQGVGDVIWLDPAGHEEDNLMDDLLNSAMADGLTVITLGTVRFTNFQQ